MHPTVAHCQQSPVHSSLGPGAGAGAKCAFFTTTPPTEASSRASGSVPSTGGNAFFWSGPYPGFAIELENNPTYPKSLNYH
jgi:hypothetical protein